MGPAYTLCEAGGGAAEKASTASQPSERRSLSAELTGVGIFVQRGWQGHRGPKLQYKEQECRLVSHHGRAEGACTLGWGLGDPLRLDQKKPVDWNGISSALCRRS